MHSASSLPLTRIPFSPSNLYNYSLPLSLLLLRTQGRIPSDSISFLLLSHLGSSLLLCIFHASFLPSCSTSIAVTQHFLEKGPCICIRMIQVVGSKHRFQDSKNSRKQTHQFLSPRPSWVDDNLSYFSYYFERILDIQQSFKVNTEFPYTLFAASPNIKILYNQNRIIKTQKLTLVHFC